jgi:hypothetical protein
MKETMVPECRHIEASGEKCGSQGAASTEFRLPNQQNKEFTPGSITEVAENK